MLLGLYSVTKGKNIASIRSWSSLLCTCRPVNVMYCNAFTSAGDRHKCIPVHILQMKSFHTKHSAGYSGFNSYMSRLFKGKRNFPEDFHKFSPAEAYAWGVMEVQRRYRDPFLMLRYFSFSTWAIFISSVAFLVWQFVPHKYFSWDYLKSLMRGDRWELDSVVNVSFKDIKGCDDALEELQHVVEFLKNPKKFTAVGGALPKGVLLVGPPGVGKTLMAKAVAGEANVSFYHVPGSHFDEVYVGTGASRLRRLFQEARRHTPCVIFIDEFDAVGGRRVTSSLHPYANQTINQLLAEMDGFETTEGIIVLAATNRQEHLDPAVLRPGRFDVQIHFSLPDVVGRKELFKHYLKQVRFDSKSHQDEILRLSVATQGFTGAEIANLVNQAAIQAGRQNQIQITPQDLWEALDRHQMGLARRPPPDADVNRHTAVHEAGHTLVALYTTDSAPLHKVTILPRDKSLGHTGMLREKETLTMTKAQFRAHIDVAMGGRVAEELFLGDKKVDTGALSDFQNATNIAETMVCQLGMSDRMGQRVFKPDGGKVSSATLEVMDEEVRTMLKDSYERAKEILTSHAKEHELLTDALLKYETLDADDVRVVIKGGKPKVAAGLETL